MGNQKLKYRPEIDGLRALAVVAVILYHAGFQWIGGGLFGVDVFFVISGYLITRLLLSDIDSKNLLLSDFYYRRARRLIPAFLFVLMTCAPIAWWLLNPDQLGFFALAAITSLLFVSNWFHASNVNYFSPEAEGMPLLHTWSLSVEEQFYVVFPVLLFVLCSFLRRKQVLVVVSVLLIFSLIVSHWIWRDNPEAVFNLTLARAWELLAGAGVAIWLSRKTVLPNAYATTAGLAMILVSMLVYRSTMDITLPYSALAVVGTTLIIVFSGESDPVTLFLKTRGLVLIGLISYSAYLWHQPVLSFIRAVIEGPLSTIHALAGIAGTLVLATLTWRYIERPFRGNAPLIKRPAVFISLAAGVSAVLIVLGVITASNNGNVNRYAVNEKVLETMDRPERISECFDKEFAHIIDNWTCHMGELTDSNPSVFYYGDSHSESLIPAFDTLSTQLAISGEYAGVPGCVPLLGVYRLERVTKKSKDCIALSNRVYEYVMSSDIKTLVIASAWSQYTDGGYGGYDMSYAGLSRNSPRTMADSRLAFVQGVKATIKAYENIGVNVLFVAQVPEQHAYAVRLYDKANRSEHLSLHDVSVSLEDHMELQAFAQSVFHSEGYTLIDVNDVMCSNGRCAVGDASKSYYFDADHLSNAGALRLVETIKKAVALKLN